MKLKLKKNSSNRENARKVKKVRIRRKISGTAECPRLCVFKSAKHMYAQLVNDDAGKTIASASSLALDTKSTGKALASEVGKEIAKVATKHGIKKVVFDRNGFLYHGRIKALADGARESGLQF